MNTNHKKSGSIFFIAVVSLAVLGMIMYSSFRNITYMLSLAREREKSELHYYLAYSLYCFITAHYTEQDDKKQETNEVIFEGLWPDKNSKYKGLAWIERKKNKKTLFIQLTKGKKNIITLSFVV